MRGGAKLEMFGGVCFGRITARRRLLLYHVLTTPSLLDSNTISWATGPLGYWAGLGWGLSVTSLPYYYSGCELGCQASQVPRQLAS